MNILHTYFDNKLVEAGFPSELTIESSLSYSQGDGVASTLGWYSRLSEDTTYGGNRRYLILDAIREARTFAQKLTELTQLRQPQ